ncbi:hypothetical protein Tco_0371319 [Tanacetum coccineum]
MVHHTFHVSNLKKCNVDEPLVIPLDGLHIDDKLYFIEENIEIRSQKVEAKLYPKLSRFVVTLGKELSIPGNMKTNSGRNIRIFSPNPYFHLANPPPRRFFRRNPLRIVETRCQSNEEYEKTRTDSNNAGRSGSANTGGTVQQCFEIANVAKDTEVKFAVCTFEESHA